MPPFTFYTKPEYLADITERISQTKVGDRVALATMSIDPHSPEIEKLAIALSAAASRGVKVDLIADAYNYLKGHHQFFGPLFFHSLLPKQLHGEFNDKHQFLESLRAQGVNCTITNTPLKRLSNPFAGRSHIKFAIINDRIYLGGCNLDDPTDTDLMVGWNDDQFSSQLYDFAQNMARAKGLGFINGRDTAITLNDVSTIYIDAGQRRQSLILDQALRLIDEARENLLFCSQFFPSGITGKHLLAAHKRGVKVTVIYNHPSAFTRNERLPQYANIALARLHMPTEFFAHQLPRNTPYMHAKIIATESAAMVGSHNYIAAGVNFGTAEIALLSNDADFAQSLIRHITHQITIY